MLRKCPIVGTAFAGGGSEKANGLERLARARTAADRRYLLGWLWLPHSSVSRWFSSQRTTRRRPLRVKRKKPSTNDGCNEMVLDDWRLLPGHFSPPSAVLRTTLLSPFCCSHSVLFVPKGAFRRRPSAQHCRHLFATEGGGQLAAASQGSAFRGKPSGLPPSSLAFAINIHLCAQLPRLWPRAAPAGAKMAGDGPKHDRHPLLSAFPRFPLLSPRRGQLHSHHSAISSVGPLPSLFGPKWTCSSDK